MTARAKFRLLGNGARRLGVWLLCGWLCAPAVGVADVALWRMEPTGINNPAVLDSVLDASIQSLWALNGHGNALTLSGDVAPAHMWNGPVDNFSSYDAAGIADVNGALLYPQNVYGDRFRFTNAFTAELFFRTHGNRSAAGPMQLLHQGEVNQRFGLVLNQPIPGNARLTLRDASGALWHTDLAVRNYADGGWHYVLAVFNPFESGRGALTLTIANEDGSYDQARSWLEPNFPGLPPGFDGNLFIGRNTFALNQDPRTFIGLIDEVQITDGLVQAAARVGRLPGTIARWGMSPTGGHFPAVRDSASGDGRHDLITFNQLGNVYPQSTNVPPLALFNDGKAPGPRSFHAAAFAGVDGALFYPQDVYGDVFSFTGPFSIEMFFRTDGEKSGAGFMQLVMQGENNFRYGLIVNEPGPGAVRFAVNNGRGAIPVVDLTGRNYADGRWHYLRASYLPGTGPNGLLVLTIVNEDLSEQSATASLGNGFAGLPEANDGNLFIGRNTFGSEADPRTFLGWIDEVQITRGGVSSGSERLGARVGAGAGPDPAISRGEASTALVWPTVPGETYVVEYAEVLGAAPVRWTPIATLTAAGEVLSYVDAHAVRRTRESGYYRVRQR